MRILIVKSRLGRIAHTYKKATFPTKPVFAASELDGCPVLSILRGRTVITGNIIDSCDIPVLMSKLGGANPEATLGTLGKPGNLTTSRPIRRLRRLWRSR